MSKRPDSGGELRRDRDGCLVTSSRHYHRRSIITFNTFLETSYGIKRPLHSPACRVCLIWVGCNRQFSMTVCLTRCSTELTDNVAEAVLVLHRAKTCHRTLSLCSDSSYFDNKKRLLNWKHVYGSKREKRTRLCLIHSHGRVGLAVQPFRFFLTVRLDEL